MKTEFLTIISISNYSWYFQSILFKDMFMFLTIVVVCILVNEIVSMFQKHFVTEIKHAICLKTLKR